MPFSQLMVLPELWPKEVMSERVKFVRGDVCGRRVGVRNRDAGDDRNVKG